MPQNVFGNSSSYHHNNGNEIGTFIFAQKPYLRRNFLESNIEEDIDLKNQNRNKKLPDPTSIREAASKSCVDENSYDPSIIKSNNQHPDIDLINKSIINVGLIEVNSWPEWGDQATSKLYVDNLVRNSVNESTLLRLYTDEKSNLNE